MIDRETTRYLQVLIALVVGTVKARVFSPANDENHIDQAAR